jgi:hypothetical protein
MTQSESCFKDKQDTMPENNLELKFAVLYPVTRHPCEGDLSRNYWCSFSRINSKEFSRMIG